MFDSAKNKLTEDTIFAERVRTLLFLSMGLKRPISVLFLKDDCAIDQAIVKTGVVITVSGGSDPDWRRCITVSFILNTDEGVWNEITDAYAISFSGGRDPVAFLRHEETINKIQHLRSIYTGLFGRIRLNMEIDDDNDSKYYRILSTIAGARFQVEP
jgi:hypothetical protein